jgi:nucleotide-binding universal stress UspA family protein
MINLQRILFPTDFSEFADRARPYAVDLAKQFGATVTVVHVITGPQFMFGYGAVLPTGSISEQIRTHASERLGKEADLFEADGVKAEIALLEGKDANELVDFAKKSKADLIVMATHGRSALKQVLMGSTAEHVVREAPCPVLTIRHPEHEFVMP